MWANAQLASALRRQPGLAIFTLAFLLRLIWVLTLQNQLTWIDEHEFAAIGEHLAHGDGYVSTSFRANPVLPYYLAIVFRLFGPNYVVARIGQSAVGALTCVILYQIGALLVGTEVGILSGLILALYLPHIYLAGIFYVDSWLIFFLALSVWLAALTMRSGGRPGVALLTGVSLGLTGLTRANFLIYLPCVCFAWMYGAHLKWRRWIAACLLLLAGCGLTILPWALRNYSVYGRPILISSGLYTMMWRGNNVLATGDADDRVFMWNTPAWRERLQQLPEEQRRALDEQYQVVDRLVEQHDRHLDDPFLATDDVLKPLAIEAVLSHPQRMTWLMFRKMRTLFSAFSGTVTENQDTTQRNRLLAALSFYPILALALVGAVLAFPRRRDLSLLYLVIIAVVASYALLTVCTRFRLPIDPYLIVFAALTLCHVWASLKGGSWTARRAVTAHEPDHVTGRPDRASDKKRLGAC